MPLGGAFVNGDPLRERAPGHRDHSNVAVAGSAWGGVAKKGAAGYGDLHATVVDAIRYVTAGQSIEEAADEVLQRLREAGLPIPDRP